MTEAADTLVQFGADPDGLRLFDEDSPELLPYATLTAARTAGDADLAAVLGVYEWQDAPLMFLVDAGRLEAGDHGLARIRRMAAMRGDAPYLGVVAPGRLDVYKIALDDAPIERARIDIGVSKAEAAATFPRLANIRPGASRPGRAWITQVVLDLLDRALDTLRIECELRIEDAISLAGRALFARFLGDRGLLPDTLQAAAGTLFDDAGCASSTSIWLDKTFNGDFLPMLPGTFERLPSVGFAVLRDIARRAPGGQPSLGWQEGWADLNFAHIPVGVLSQAYERYQAKHAPVVQRHRGSYYTPRPIAELMVRAAFAPLVEEGVAAQARVLDPAAGAGVFLLSTFRRLVAERWRRDGTRPSTEVLRDILYRQLTGLDIDESALRFAALGLYLISIELDPNPEPVAKLGFENLRDRVLHRVPPGGDGVVPCLGSLDPACSAAPAGSYDLIIGNPPWTSGTGLPGWQSVVEFVADIARRRSNGTPLEARLLPNEVLDLPFVWRAMEWARPGGQIAFAVHGRILFQQGDGMPRARSALFSALDVTGVVNGAELRQTDVWPNVLAPFCLLFARNRVPSAESAFRFVSPRLERSLNQAGVMRIDALSADLVTASQVTERPDILKILFRGGEDDLRLIERIETRELICIYDYWKLRFGLEGRRLRFSGNGYQTLRDSSRPRRGDDSRPGHSARHLHGLPEITAAALDEVLIDVDHLPTFSLERVHRVRERTIFDAPILIVHKSPPARGTRIRIGIALRDVVYDQSFYGYSAKAHKDGAALCRFLGLIIGSKPALWLALITSGEFGFERDTLEKSTVDGILVPNFDDLPRADRVEANRLFDRLCVANDEPTWSEVDAWVARLYGLRRRDLQIINDTLRYNLPFAKNRAIAQKQPTGRQTERFRTVLEAELQPWGRRNGRTIAVHPSPTVGVSPWRGLQVMVGAERAAKPEAVKADWPSLLLAADHVAATLMIYHDRAAGCLAIELLDQARYWTETRACNLARKLIWEHVDALTGLSAA